MVKAVLLALALVFIVLAFSGERGTLYEDVELPPVASDQQCLKLSLVQDFPGHPKRLGLADIRNDSVEIRIDQWPATNTNGTYSTQALLNWTKADHHNLYILLLHEVGWHLALDMHGHASKGIGYKYPLEAEYTAEEAADLEQLAVAFFPNTCVLN